ncbi:NAD(P)-dependent oxidoreductase [Paenibacillus sp. LPE1-1-1.1]|uniref:NAD(P)-dependent oxidoreductase n=1 Tax=Paenibacillus sp. LPE1-1-1.1 TaxID=3135230 RepID=UPI0034372D57
MKIAIIGTGLMGSALAEGLMKAGHEVIIYNRTASRTEPLVALGAKAVLTPADAIVTADASILVLLDGASVRDLLLNDITLAAVKGKKLLNTSTTSTDEILEFSKEVKEHGGSLAEASILVGPEELRTGHANFSLACDADDETFWTEILSSIGPTSKRVGEVGVASNVTTAIGLVWAFNMVSSAYAAAALLKLNIPKEVGINALSAIIPDAEVVLSKLLARDYDIYLAKIDDVKISMDKMVRTADSLNIPSKILNDIRDLFVEASKRGLGERDITSLLEVLLEPNLKNN